MRHPASLALVLSLAAAPAMAQENELAQQLSNPIADLISVPIQVNYDTGFGPSDGWRLTTNIQPVIPIHLNEDWNVVSRTIVPVIAQNDIAGPSGDQFGLGDITQSLFFSPKEPAPSGLIWGVGPVAQIPTGTDSLLGNGKLSLGPTAVGLLQTGPWTIGGLTNHLWSVAGEGGSPNVNATFIQPFMAYNLQGWTLTLNSESLYDWTSSEWSVPINALVGKVVAFGKQPVQFTAGLRYWAASSTGGPEGLGGRFQVTFLFPK